MNDQHRAQSEYWSSQAVAFDRIYSHRKSSLSNFLDRFFRKDMYDRLAFTLEHCAPAAGRTFLDVGCGRGVYSITLARQGASHVTGLDIAENMLTLCRSAAQEAGLNDRCTFVHSDLLAYAGKGPFDVTIGIGLFDYVADPLPVLRRMKEVSADKVIVSFPRLLTWRAPLRKIRLTLRGCAVYFFTRRTVARLLGEAGFPRYNIIKVGKLHCVVAYTKT
jgi:cyclopropane fatty-acyl-phospholipid synthase-like methyltransferase